MSKAKEGQESGGLPPPLVEGLRLGLGLRDGCTAHLPAALRQTQGILPLLGRLFL